MRCFHSVFYTYDNCTYVYCVYLRTYLNNFYIHVITALLFTAFITILLLYLLYYPTIFIYVNIIYLYPDKYDSLQVLQFSFKIFSDGVNIQICLQVLYFPQFSLYLQHLSKPSLPNFIALE